MLCPTCGRDQVYTNRFNISSVSPAVNEMLRQFPSTVASTFHSSISQILSDVEADFSYYGSEISGLQTRLLYLRTKQNLLKKHRERLQSLSSPIRKLPIELLTQIFTFVCDIEAVRIDKSARHFVGWRSPFVLASVCNGWRQIVTASPQMWSNLYYDNDFYGPPFEAALRLCLERSKSYPLSLKIDILGGSTSTSLLELLVEQSTRWRHVQILVGTSLSESPLSIMTGKPLQLLESLEILDCDDEYCDLNAFQSVPRLRSLHLDAMPALNTALDFPFANISHLKLTCLRWNTVFRALEAFPNLQSVIYQGFDSETAPGDVASQTSNLSKLEFWLDGDHTESPDSDDHNQLRVMFEKLTLPSLNSFTLMSTDWISPLGLFKAIWPREAVSQFFERSKCSLSILCLDHIPLSDKDAILLLRLVPSLQELRIKEIHRKSYNFKLWSFKYPDLITPSFLTALHAYDSTHEQGTISSPLVPNLQRLEFLADGDLFDDQLFLEMVVSRWMPDKEYASVIGVSSLQSVKIGVEGRELKEDVKQRLLYLGRAGLKVMI